jgi:prepilin-type N-terminal cleavage/methylation domain-containing protein
MMPKKRSGVSLVELLVVLTIIGILVALSLPALRKALNTAQDTDTRNDLRQLAVAYNNYWVAKKRAPNSQQQLSPFYENSGGINEAIDTGRITVIWGVAAATDSNPPLAYETQADRIGNRMVGMADGSVQTVNEAEFAAMLKTLAK